LLGVFVAKNYLTIPKKCDNIKNDNTNQIYYKSQNIIFMSLKTLERKEIVGGTTLESTTNLPNTAEQREALAKKYSKSRRRINCDKIIKAVGGIGIMIGASFLTPNHRNLTKHFSLGIINSICQS
jgi:hypothetical protein